MEINKFSIVGFSETWLSDGVPDKFIAPTANVDDFLNEVTEVLERIYLNISY